MFPDNIILEILRFNFGIRSQGWDPLVHNPLWHSKSFLLLTRGQSWIFQTWGLWLWMPRMGVTTTIPLHLIISDLRTMVMDVMDGSDYNHPSSPLYFWLENYSYGYHTCEWFHPPRASKNNFLPLSWFFIWNVPGKCGIFFL